MIETPEAATPATPPAGETHTFQAEVSQLLHLVIHSLYSHKEIFLRELVSNASDALDRLRFKALTDPTLLGEETTLEIHVTPDKAAGTLTIEDNGTGMTHDELVTNLGTIAHSGTKKFLEELAARGTKDARFIGQFGVGFYSAWLVAKQVDVTTRAAGSTEAWTWTSDAKESFTLTPAERATRGTSVVLHLADDQKEFLETWRLRELLTRYSDYVSHPIKLQDEDGKELETVNRASALWQRPRSEITDEQYNEFYTHLTHDPEAPLARAHFKVEGSQEFAGLLFVPRKAPFDLHHNTQKRRGVRLFVRRVFIMDDCEEILPPWLRFVRGVVDSDDLPLNVSREIPQDSAIVRAIKKQVTRKTLDALDEMAKDRREDYETFWRAFGTVLKEGLAGDFEYRERLGALVRYESTHGEGLTSLADYVSRMPAGQDAIYYVYGESRRAVEHSPHLEGLRKRGYEVLYMTDPIDEWAADGLREFQGKKLVSAMRAELALGGDEAKAKDEAAQSGAFAALIDRVKQVLGDSVKDVRLSDRLTDSPCCLVVPEGASHAYLERLLRENGRDVGGSKRIFELNPDHPLIQALRDQLVAAPDRPEISEWIELLHEQALLTEGSRIEDPQRFARRMTTLLTQAVRA